MIKPASERFWAQVRKTSGCWLWTGVKQASGYGRFHYGGKKWKSNRVAWIFCVGLIPNGMHVLHKCDNPSCVNPKHLWLGTHQDNIADRERKGRNRPPRGDGVSCHALTEPEVKEIRNMMSLGKTPKLLSELYGVSRTTIWCIAKRKTWAHVV